MRYTSIPLDANGRPFSRATFRLPVAEYGKIVSEINQLYETVYKGKRIAAHTSFGMDGMAYVYWFENHGFNDYNIFMRVSDDH